MYSSLYHSRNSSATDSVVDKSFLKLNQIPLSSLLWVQLEVEILK